MNQLEVKVKQELGVIDFNFNEIKDNLSSMMELYTDAKFTEESSALAKKEVAALRNIKKALNDRRIEIKKEYMQPYDDFALKVKELTDLIDQPIELIDKQVQAFEEKKKEEKKQKISELYNELIGEVREYLPIEKIYDNKWENTSVSMKSIKAEIEKSVSSVEMAVTTIKEMNSDVETMVLSQFKKDLSLANAISYIKHHEKMKAEILAKEEARRKEEEERKRREEEKRIRDEERKRVEEEQRKIEEAKQKALEEERIRVIEREKELFVHHEEKVVEQVLVEMQVEEQPFEVIEEAPFTVEEEQPFIVNPTYDLVYKITATEVTFTILDNWLKNNGIDFERGNI